MNRISLDEYFFRIAELVALRSTCLHRQVGAIIVKDKHIIATGYNGAPSGEPHCLDIGCSKPIAGNSGGSFNDCRAVHAEVNAIIQAAKYGHSINGCIIYCTLEPCVICKKIIKNAGLRIKYDYAYY